MTFPPRQQYTCPICGMVGAQYVDSPVPLCHSKRCNYKVYMQPSTNGVIKDPKPPEFKEGTSPSNYQSAVRRIKACRTKADCKALEKSLERCYRAGAFTDSEYQRLDGKLVDRSIEMEES